MKLSRTKLAKIIADKSVSLSEKELSDQVAAYLLSERRTGELDSLMRDVMELRAETGLVEVVATHARPISEAVRLDIKDLIKKIVPQAQHVIVSEEIDPSIIGGVRLELANQQLDLSVRAKLNRFKQLTVAAGGV